VRKIFKIQSLLLLVGSIFAWVTVYTDFSRFYGLYGDITRVRDCVIPNPVTTPCFYGAFAFLISFFWSLSILRSPIQKKNASQKKLQVLLIGSVVFAWSNFALEIYNFYFKSSANQISCSGVPATSVFVTPCFIGSMLFLSSLLVSLVITLNRRKK